MKGKLIEMCINNPKINFNTLSEKERNVVEYMKKLLCSEKNNIIQNGYYYIRNSEQERIFNEKIKHIEDKDFDSLFPLVSVVILTANKIECDSLNFIVSCKKRMSCVKKRKHSLKIIPGFNEGVAEAFLFKIHYSYILHINAYETGSFTPGGSSDIIRFITNHKLLQPSIIISLGVCYGRNMESQNIGDVIIPKKLYPWSIGQKITENSLEIKHDNFNLDLFSLFNKTDTYNNLRTFCDGENGKIISESISVKDDNGHSQRFNFKIKTYMGNMSTGEAVISSEKIKEEIRMANKNFEEIGGEMEGYGMAKECVYYADIPCVIIKSICDWGILKNMEDTLINNGIEHTQNLKDKLQTFAAFCSSLVLLKLFEKEKKTFFVTKIYEKLSNSIVGKEFLNGYKPAEKDKIKKWVKKFYKISDNEAEQMLEGLINNKIIVRDVNKKGSYRISKSISAKIEGD